MPAPRFREAKTGVQEALAHGIMPTSFGGAWKPPGSRLSLRSAGKPEGVRKRFSGRPAEPLLRRALMPDADFRGARRRGERRAQVIGEP